VRPRAARGGSADASRAGCGREFPYLCTSDADCTGPGNGRCTGNELNGFECTYDDCFTDADCHRTFGGKSETGVWECDGGPDQGNVCLYQGNCKIDSDCGPPGEGFCSPSFGECGFYSGVTGYFCHAPADECTGDADCGGAGQIGDSYCAHEPAVGHYARSTSACVG
jgi:hypothetical protein